MIIYINRTMHALGAIHILYAAALSVFSSFRLGHSLLFCLYDSNLTTEQLPQGQPRQRPLLGARDCAEEEKELRAREAAEDRDGRGPQRSRARGDVKGFAIVERRGNVLVIVLRKKSILVIASIFGFDFEGVLME
jgi:hypothetical protein